MSYFAKLFNISEFSTKDPTLVIEGHGSAVLDAP